MFKVYCDECKKQVNFESEHEAIFTVLDLKMKNKPVLCKKCSKELLKIEEEVTKRFKSRKK